MERDKDINLFKDVRDDGYEYGWEETIGMEAQYLICRFSGDHPS